jgi:hypothetical protein
VKFAMNNLSKIRIDWEADDSIWNEKHIEQNGAWK